MKGALSVALMLGVASPVLAGDLLPRADQPMALGAPVSAPVGYLKFCVRRPTECGLAPESAQPAQSAFANALHDQPASTTSGLQPGAVIATRIKADPAEDRAAQGGARTVAQAVWEAAPASAEDAAPRCWSDPFRQQRWEGALPSGADFDEGGYGLPTARLQRARFQITVPHRSVRRSCVPQLATHLVAAPVIAAPVVAARMAAAVTRRPETLSANSPIVHLDQALLSRVTAINDRINETIRPMSDEQAFGVSNYWTLPITVEHRPVGNCKHYALEKRRALVDAGVAEAALSLAIVRTREGELHAILLLATDRGEVVLDNLTSRVIGWSEAHYTWLARQLPGQPLRWVAVSARA